MIPLGRRLRVGGTARVIAVSVGGAAVNIRTFSVALILSALLVIPLSLGAAEPTFCEKMLPADSVLAVVLRDANATRARWKGTALYDLLQNDEMKQMLAPLNESLSRLTQQGQEAAGVKIDLAPLFTGDAAAGLVIRNAADRLEVETLGAQLVLHPTDAVKGKASFDALLAALGKAGFAKGLTQDGVPAFEIDDGALLFYSFDQDVALLTLSAGGGEARKAAGAALHKETLARRAQAGGIAYDPEYVLMRSKMGDGQEAWIYLGLFPWLNRQQMLAPMAQPFLTMAGLQDLQGCIAGIAIEGKAFRTRAFIHMPPAPNAPKPALITQEQLALVPRDALAFEIGSADWQGIYDKGLMLVGMIPNGVGQEISQGIARAEAAIGMSIRNDILGSLQGQTLMYVTEPDSPVGRDYSVFFKLRDRADATQKLTKLLTGISGLIQREIGPDGEAFVRINTIERPRMTQIYPQSVLPGMITPNFMISDTGWASLGFSARNAVGKMDYFLNHRENISARADFTQSLAKVPQAYTSISYTDSGRCFGNALAMAQICTDIGAIIGKAVSHKAHEGPNDGPFQPNQFWSMDPGRWPSDSVLREKLFGAVSVWSPQSDGWLYENYSPVGPLPMPPTEPNLFAGNSIATTSIMAGMLLPALARARGEARTVNCMSNLSQIMKAVVAYQEAHADNMPPSLDALFPAFLASQKVLVCSADQTPMKLKNGCPCSYRYIGNTPFRDAGPGQFVAYDHLPHRDGRGFGRNVAHFDGHVRFYNEQEFHNELARQYELFKPLMARPNFPGNEARARAFFEDQDFEEQ